jgi:putative YphP/YqiW family bacilliredoxin
MTFIKLQFLKLCNFVNRIIKHTIMYPEEMVKPMKAELTDAGFQELYSAADVDNVLAKEGTTLVVINSVCGCAARNARPGAKMSLDNAKKPSNTVTVFAGVDKEAVDSARQFMLPYPPSSPCVALFKDGKLVHFLERHHIEGRTPELIASNLKTAIEHYC